MPALSPLSFSASIDVLLFSPEVNQACGQFGGDKKKKEKKGREEESYTYVLSLCLSCAQKGPDVTKSSLCCIRDMSLAGGELVLALLC